MAIFNEDTRVKIPATVQYMRLGYQYQSLKDVDLHSETRIAVNRFKPALERINGRTYSNEEVQDILNEIHSVIRNSDMGQAFYRWLVQPVDRPTLIDFEHIENNDFAVIDELTFGKSGAEDDKEGSFRPDITVLINGIPLAFLEVKHPNNDGGIQVEFNRMLNKRLERDEYKKYFNMLQVVSFSNNMEYETDDDSAMAEDVKAGSFYTTPNGFRTTFSFFRDEHPKQDGFIDVSKDVVRQVLADNHYNPAEYDSAEFQLNLDKDTPCNRFVTSLFDKDRIMYLLRYGITYVSGEYPEKHIMRYPQYFASKALVHRLENGGKSGIIWHTQGSGKTELAAFSTRILRDYYAKQNILTRFYYVVDRLDLLVQIRNEMSKRGLHVIEVNSKAEFEAELNKSISTQFALDADGEITVVNIQKFDDDMPVVNNAYGLDVQRVIFIDEAHRSYRETGEFYKNLKLIDPDAVYVALTGTPLLKKECSTDKFGDYIHKYFYDRSIADGYTLRIKKESIETTARTEIKKNLELEDPKVAKSDVTESEDYINAICRFIEKDFQYFRLTNNDNTIGGMIVCSSNPQAKKIKRWFDENSEDLEVGLVISDPDIPTAMNKETQISFKEKGRPDILVVHQMLTTGYDVARLKKMYLLRNVHEHTLLQTISRVNRPYKSPSGTVYRYGYIVDFVDISEEFDRTIEMYLKELSKDFDGEDGTNFGGLIVGPEDINKKYKAYVKELDGIIDTVNLERFSRQLSFMTKDTLWTIRRLLNGIKNCHTEFKLSHADNLASQIDMLHIRGLLKCTQDRIDFVNLASTPTSLLSIISNKEVTEILYEFFKTRVEVLDLSRLDEVMRRFAGTDDYQQMIRLVEQVQNEIKRNRNHQQIRMVKLDEVLQQLFAMLNIDNLLEINEQLQAILDEIRAINDENERISLRYNGNYAFVKTYTDAIDAHPGYDAEDIASVLDAVYACVKNLESVNMLVLQGRENFIAGIKRATVVDLVKSKLYGKLRLKEWYDELLSETYANMKIF